MVYVWVPIAILILWVMTMGVMIACAERIAQGIDRHNNNTTLRYQETRRIEEERLKEIKTNAGLRSTATKRVYG